MINRFNKKLLLSTVTRYFHIYREKSLKKPFFTLVFSFLTLFFVTGIGILLFSLLYSGRVYPRVSVQNISLTGKTQMEGKKELETTLSPRFPRQITLMFDTKSWDIPTASIAAVINYDRTVQGALQYGRHGTIWGNMRAIGYALIYGISLPMEITIDTQSLKTILASLARDIDIPKEEPSLSILSLEGSPPEIKIFEGKNGRVLDQEIAFSKIQQHIQNFAIEPLSLPVSEQPVEANKGQLDHALQRANTLLSKSLTVSVDEINTILEGKELISFIGINEVYNAQNIASFAATLAESVNRSPQEATFQLEGNKVVVFRPSKKGLMLDSAKTQTAITDALVKLERSSDTTLTIPIVVTETPPLVSTADANSFGITELLGRGVSYFKGSSAERIYNIKHLTSKLHGVLIPPGKTFSLVETVGDISQATGFKQAFIIQNGRTVLGDGGGSCQPSTTLFRAVINAGLPIEERNPHAYRVSYYEQGGFQPGLDASIFTPNVDLKFKNDSPNYILIQANVNTENTELSYELYGTKDGRQISISPVRIWDQTPAPPTLYQDDPTLPKGVVKQIDFSAPGAKTAFDYKVTKNGTTIQEKTFFSTYRPWQAIFLRGTKE